MRNIAYSFIKFNDEVIDSKIMMELTDLTRLLLKQEKTTVMVRKFSYFNPVDNVFNLSFFWKHRQDISELEGFRYDILTRYPSIFIFDYALYSKMKEESRFTQQIFLSLEYNRTRKYALQERPLIVHMIGPGDTIMMREYEKPSKSDAEKFLKGFNVAILKSEDSFYFMDEYFNIITHSTAESIKLAIEMTDYLSRYISVSSKFQIHDMPFSEIESAIRKDDLRKDAQKLESKSNEDQQDEMRQIDTKTDRDAGQANMIGETGDNASHKNDHGKQNDYNDDVDDYHEGFGTNTGDNHFMDSYSANHNAVLNIVQPKINLTNYTDYKSLYDIYHSTARKIILEIMQILDYKINSIQDNRSSGRLMKNPVGPMITGSHKVFTKKNTESREIDAAFTLIIDQSFSMMENLEGCRNGAIIINNVLKTLEIPHRIISHHEDTFEVMKNHYPNTIYEHMDFERSKYYYPVSLLNIEASGDNRDGMILRHEMELLNRRNEKNKFIIMFSDGLPSAEEYNQSGIIDTHEAVQEAAKNGIGVINIFINQDNEENTLEAIKNIYDTNVVIVDDAEDIVYVLPQLMQRLLTQMLL
ncbi:VWA domain-containing protein [Salinicoccus siamensis]|uniref:VWA domain-containing protein n=1 Tax=Salinicoccus siamensis TaxID=381830 RepID=UPI00360AED1B